MRRLAFGLERRVRDLRPEARSVLSGEICHRALGLDPGPGHGPEFHQDCEIKSNNPPFPYTAYQEGGSLALISGCQCPPALPVTISPRNLPP